MTVSAAPLTGFTFALLAACHAGATASGPPSKSALRLPVEAISFEVAFDRPLSPPELRWSIDVRWAEDDAVWVAAGRSGVFEIELDGRSEPRPLASGGQGPDGHFLAASGGAVAAAVGFGVVSWIDLSGHTQRATPMSTLVDFDLWNDTAVFLGARRDELGRWAPERAVLWSGSLRDAFDQMAPRMYSASGTPATEVAQCGDLELGAVRFFPDGRYVVVPGFQPGAFLYDRHGKLLRAWESQPLDFYDRCDIGWETSDLLKRDPAARLEWVHQRPVLDEVVPWGDWPALVIRRPRSQQTTWQLVVLTDQGASEPVDLPIVTNSTGSHLRADVREGRLVVLISEFGPADQPPQQSPRLVVLEVGTATRSSSPTAEAGR